MKNQSKAVETETQGQSKDSPPSFDAGDAVAPPVENKTAETETQKNPYG